MKERNIFVCTEYSAGGATLKQVGGSLGFMTSMDLPNKIGQQLVGYQCLAEGGCGDFCKIIKWFDLPSTQLDIKDG